MSTVNHARRRRCPHGLSILEFLGCLSALAGGLVLGSIYLGVDVKDMAYCVLEQAQVVEPRVKADDSDSKQAEAGDSATESTSAPDASGRPPRATTPTPEPGTATTDSTTPADPAPNAADSGAGTTHESPAEAAPTETGTTLPAPVAGLFAREDLITPQQRHALTVAYWEALAVCMQNEVHERVPAIDDEGNWQLFDYLNGRKAGHAKAAEAIAALDQRGVDDHVLAYTKKAHAWHQDGARLFARAVDLLTDAPTAQLSGPFAQSWQSAATQHRMEARLLVEKQQAVQSYLNHTYAAAAGAPEAPPAK